MLLVAALVGCGHPKASGPKWPEPSTTAEDGGESSEPKPSATYAAAVEKSTDDNGDKPAASASPGAAAAASPGDDKPAPTATPSQPATDDVIMTEEIIIEIED